MILIAEIGNNHFGDYEKAKDMVKLAASCGATLIKGQAFKAKNIKGSMPPEFYEKCQFSLKQYVDLIYYSRSWGVDMFYSIFSPELEGLLEVESFHKMPAGISQDATNYEISLIDSERTFISFNDRKINNLRGLPKVKKSSVLYATDYLSVAPNMDNINKLSNKYKRRAGFSDHTIGVRRCIEAIRDFRVTTIEKHFVLPEDRNKKFMGITFRDTVHAADPEEFKIISKELSK